MLVLRSCNHTSKDIQWYCMISTKPCARQITIMYDLVRTACGFFNLLKVDMFLNPTNIEPARDAADKYLLSTPEGEMSAEFHGIPHMNPSFILLNMGYPMNCYWGKLRDACCFDNVLYNCIYISKIYIVYVRAYYKPFQRYSRCSSLHLAIIFALLILDALWAGLLGFNVTCFASPIPYIATSLHSVPTHGNSKLASLVGECDKTH